MSCELPLQAIAGLMGVPQEDRKKLFDWSNQMVGDMDPEFAGNDAITASVELIMYGMAMAADRGANPRDDLVTRLVQADVEGHKLSDDEFGFFVILLAVAGNETTRNTITQGMMAFAEHPDQWELFKRERPATAADEIVRWATPVTSFQRTALTDYELSGVPIKKGQRVVMSYRSANFDEEVFDDPYSFNVLRDPNPHVGFGGTGTYASGPRWFVVLLYAEPRPLCCFSGVNGYSLPSCSNPRQPRTAHSPYSRSNSASLALSTSSRDLSGGYTRSRGTSCSSPDTHIARACPSVNWSRWDTVVMLRLPDVGLTSVPLMSTTCLPSYSASVLNVGPGPSDTNGTVTAASRNPNTTIGTRATATVALRLFTPDRKSVV